MDDAADIFRAAGAVDVIVEDCVGVEAKSFVLAAVGEGVGDDFEVWGDGVNTGRHSAMAAVTMWRPLASITRARSAEYALKRSFSSYAGKLRRTSQERVPKRELGNE